MYLNDCTCRSCRSSNGSYGSHVRRVHRWLHSACDRCVCNATKRDRCQVCVQAFVYVFVWRPSSFTMYSSALSLSFPAYYYYYAEAHLLCTNSPYDRPVAILLNFLLTRTLMVVDVVPSCLLCLLLGLFFNDNIMQRGSCWSCVSDKDVGYAKAGRGF